MPTTQTCTFCSIAAGEVPAEVVHEWPDAIAIIPFDAVTAGGGHVLVLPRCHVASATEDPTVTGTVAVRAAQLANALGWEHLNMIDNVGADASQTVFHYHRHMIRRRAGDRIQLPWPQEN
ncbi:HIT family protein [Lentzea sp. CC55]|uniref:HIT family protein n=1 Tax=Lentzea sp. CC55 TaxID=2884909 RepID=UPI001F3F0A1F|nr:HIT domain-containing protein [Lentzea sp. CC55]MCG8925194.1 HIT domain-containing protein [Lentzea sp. CC55]